MKHLISTIVLSLVCGLLASCGPKTYDNPESVMMDKTQGTAERLAAAEQAEKKMPDDPKRLADLRLMTWERGYSTELRNFAIDSLIRHDEAAAKKHLASAIALMNNWDTIQHLLDVAVERNWTDFTPAIVRCYARPAWLYQDDAKRPEAKALLALHPGKTIEQIVFDVFAHDPDADVRQRASAWALMNRLVPDKEKLLAMLDGVPATDPLVLDLQAAAKDLHVTADSMRTIAWLQSMRQPAHKEFWDTARDVVVSLNAEQRKGLELRHIPLIVHLEREDPPLSALSRSQLLQQVSVYISGQEHYNKSAGYDGGNPDRDQTLRHWEPQLSWGDLLVMRTLISVMNNPADRALIFAQADADLKDTSTEYGGLITWKNDGPLMLVPYTPMFRKNNLAYYSPEQLTTDSYFALAHYHPHAQKYKNADYAGPGRGDLERIADTQRYNGVLFTFIDENRINVDFYRHGTQGGDQGHDGVVVDLGTISR